MAREDYDEAKRIKAGIDRLKVGGGEGEGEEGGGIKRQIQESGLPTLT